MCRIGVEGWRRKVRRRERVRTVVYGSKFIEYPNNLNSGLIDWMIYQSVSEIMNVITGVKSCQRVSNGETPKRNEFKLKKLRKLKSMSGKRESPYTRTKS